MKFLDKLAAKVRVVRVQSDMAATNELLRELITTQNRQSAALERILLAGFGIDMNASTETLPEEPLDVLTLEQEEQIAAIEVLEDLGYVLPPGIYEKFGLATPRTEEPAPATTDAIDEPEPIAAERSLWVGTE